MTTPTLRLLSLGAGVQSTTLLLMSLNGQLPKIDAAIFADTGWEPARVYEHLSRVTAEAARVAIPVIQVSKGNLRADATDPLHRYASIPYFVLHADGTVGMGRRQCTNEYKLAEINRKVRDLLGAAPPDFRRVPKGQRAEVWVGFSADEIGRVNDRSPGYIQMRYPLIDLGMDRKACKRWLRSLGWPSVGKSACVGCPYHLNEQWRDMRDNHPDEWADAVAFDKSIRNGGANPLPAGSHAFLHRSCIPLDQAPIDRITRVEWKTRQGDLLDVIADSEVRDGCSPYGCRSGAAVA